jgi:eukaryotic-like serine/threonine-protein kinase
VLGQPRAQARATLEGADLEVTMTETESDEPEGQVVETDPAPNASVPVGSTVEVLYSDGPEEVPDVVGLRQQRAERTLDRAGFQVDVVETSDTDEPKGTVIRQSPAGGQTAPNDSTVTIVVSSFEEPSESPSPTESPTDSPSPTESPSGTDSPLGNNRARGPQGTGSA